MIKLIAIVLICLCYKHCPGDPHCISCKIEDDKTVCKGCQYSQFNPTNNTCSSIDAPIDNCVVYSNNDTMKCSVCELYYGKTRDFKCIECPENCANCNDSGVCLSCSDAKKPVEGKCKGKRESCADPNCQICRLDNSCELCKSGFSYDFKAGCIKGINDCYLLQDNGEKCFDCNYGYYVDENFKCSKFKSDSSAGTVLLIILSVLLVLAFVAFFIYKLIKNKQENQRRDLADDYVNFNGVCDAQ